MPTISLYGQILGCLALVVGAVLLKRYVDKAADEKIEKITQARRSNILDRVVEEHMLRQETRIRLLEKLLDLRSKDWEDQL